MDIKVTLVNKEDQEAIEKKERLGVPRYSVVRITGDESITRDLFEKLTKDEKYSLE